MEGEPERVTTLERLQELAKEKRSVKIVWMQLQVKPAAFVINMSGTIILNMFKTGMYVYEKEQR